MSVLVTRLLLEWSEGFMSAIGVQRCCKASQDDAEMAGQTVHPEIAKLASLGSTGRQRSHATRDLLTWYLKNVYVAETTDIEIPVMDPGTSGVTLGHMAHSGTALVDFNHGQTLPGNIRSIDTVCDSFLGRT